MIKLLDLRTRFYRNKGYEITQITSFDNRFDSFSREVSKEFGIISLRNSKYLNWKYIQKPYTQYNIYTAINNNKLLGYIVFRIDEYEGVRKGIILDVLTYPERLDVLKGLIVKTLDYFSKAKSEYVTCLVTYPPFRKLLRRYGFFQAKNPEPFMIANWEGVFSRDYVQNIENWYITLGDSDGDAWAIT